MCIRDRVRLDAETKISENLEMLFLSTKNDEREANLLYLLQEVIKIPLASRDQLAKFNAQNIKDNASDSDSDGDDKRQKGKRKKFKKERLPPANQLPSEKSTILFVPIAAQVMSENVVVRFEESDYNWVSVAFMDPRVIIKIF